MMALLLRTSGLLFSFRDYLGYLFQDFGLIESQTVKENLNLGLVGKS